MLLYCIAVTASIIGLWKILSKMGRQGWEALIPFYSTYVLVMELYQSSKNFWMLFIPFYNIYLLFVIYIDLAHSFGKSTGFGIGLTLLFPIFGCVLGFNDSASFDRDFQPLGSGSSGQASVKNTANSLSAQLNELNELLQSGVITQEDYDAKKKQLLGI